VSYPLLIVGIFTEIERERLLNRAEELVDRFLLRTEALSSETRSWKQILNRQGEKIGDLLQLYNDSRNLAKGLSDVKTQLLKLLEHIQELESSPRPIIHCGGFENRVLEIDEQRRRITQIGSRMRERLLEISEEYDRKIDDCKMVMEDLTVTTQLVCVFHTICYCIWRKNSANKSGHGSSCKEGERS
jgi:hypothetical protein